MSSKLDPFARIKSAFSARSPDERSKTPLPPKPPGAAPSKGPPPLPKSAVLAPPGRDSLPVEQIFFQEGIDGHAESVPPDGASPLPLGGVDPLAGEATRAARSTIPPTSLDEEWLEPEEELEDPARTRRRRAARVGTAWGTVVALAAAGVAIFVSPRRDGLSAAAATSPSLTETTVARSPAATPAPTVPPGQGAQAVPVAVAPPPPPVRVATTAAPAPVPPAPATCRPGMVSPVAGRATCVDVGESFLCGRDPRTRALRPVGCVEAKSPKAACESRGARLATAAERQALAGGTSGKGKTGAASFRCAAPAR